MNLDFEEIRHAVEAVCGEGESELAPPPVSVAVCDAQGDLVFFRRDPDAPGFSADFACGKAYTAARFNNATADLEAAWADRPVFALSLLSQGKWFIGRGGFPIRDGNRAIGGVGVSGNTADHEEQIAAALAQALSI